METMLWLAGLLVFAVTAGAVYQGIGARRGARRYGPPGWMIDADGQRLHVVCAGTGEPAVLFEAGIAASSLSWTRVQQRVSEFTHACAYDRAGLGWSAPASSARTVARMLRELGGVLESADHHRPAVLVGHSFGALLVLAYASQHPADVAGVVLLDPPTDWQDIGPQRSRLLWGGIQLSRLGGLLARLGVVRACLALLTGGAPAVPRNFVRVFGPTAARTLEHLVGEVRKLPPEIHPIVQSLWCDPKCFGGMAAHLGALPEASAVAAGVSSLHDVPLVIVSGGDQPPAILAAHRDLATLSSRGRHVVAAGSAHWIQLDEPDLVVDIVRDLLQEVRKSGDKNS